MCPCGDVLLDCPDCGGQCCPDCGCTVRAIWGDDLVDDFDDFNPGRAVTAATPGEAGRDVFAAADGTPHGGCPRCGVVGCRIAAEAADARAKTRADRGAALDQARRDGAAEALREAADELQDVDAPRDIVSWLRRRARAAALAEQGDGERCRRCGLYEIECDTSIRERGESCCAGCGHRARDVETERLRELCDRRENEREKAEYRAARADRGAALNDQGKL